MSQECLSSAQPQLCLCLDIDHVELEPDLQTDFLAWTWTCLIAMDLPVWSLHCVWPRLWLLDLILTLTCQLTSWLDLRPASSPQTCLWSGLLIEPGCCLWDCPYCHSIAPCQGGHCPQPALWPPSTPSSPPVREQPCSRCSLTQQKQAASQGKVSQDTSLPARLAGPVSSLTRTHSPMVSEQESRAGPGKATWAGQQQQGSAKSPVMAR